MVGLVGHGQRQATQRHHRTDGDVQGFDLQHGFFMFSPAAVRRPDRAGQHAGGQRLPRPQAQFLQPARRPDAIARADVLLARFRLAEHRERRVAELPGGVRKLLDIAMARGASAVMSRPVSVMRPASGFK